MRRKGLMSKSIGMHVTHIGEDYGLIEITDDNGDTEEYEISKSLALAIQKNLEEK
jgi:hypothetical protein